MNKFYKKLLSEVLIQSVGQTVVQVGEGLREYLKDRRIIENPELRPEPPEVEVPTLE